jgi:hypothetical protein
MAIVLQKPSIISIKKSIIKIAHPDISRSIRTYLISSFTAGGTTLAVADNDGLANNDYILLGDVGVGKSEEINISAAVTRGTSLTIGNSTKFSHELDTPVILIKERQIKLYGASTSDGTGTLIGSAFSIQWDKPETTYVNTGTAYAYYYVTFYDGTTEGTASDYVASTGLADNSVEGMIQNALNLTGEDIGEKITRDFLITELNNWQDAVSQFVDENGIQKDWPWEVVEDETSISLTENENRYLLSSLTSEMKYPNSNQGIQSVKIKQTPIDYIDVDEFDEKMEDTIRTTVSTAITAGATSIVLTNTYEFAESGTVYIGSDTITYTGNTESTGTLTGCSGVSNNHSVGDTVWQGVTPDLPENYTIRVGYIYFDCPVDTDYVGYKIRFRYLKKLTRLADYSDTTEITFYNTAQFYLASVIEARKGNDTQADKWMRQFTMGLLQGSKREKAPVMEEMTYYDFTEKL